MNIPLSIELLAGILGGLIVSMLVMLFLQVRSSFMVNRIAAPAYEFVQHQAEEEAAGIIAAAKQQAEAILVSAETERAQVLAAYTQHAADLQGAYQENIKQHADMLTQKMNGAIAVHLEKLDSIGQQSLDTLEAGRDKLNQRFMLVLESFTATEKEIDAAAEAALGTMSRVVENASNTLTNALATQDMMVKTKLDEHTKAALTALDGEILAYKKARLHLLDTHINTIVESVTKRVLQKQLTITDHAELARDALAAAKRESIL
jgi:KaiC/GvpD/RAD55 family RecA-like ATPase